MIEISDRDFVVPGQLLGEGRFSGPVYTEGEKTFSLVKGLARVNDRQSNIIALNGAYIPKAGDVVVGVIEMDLGGVYLVNIDSAYKCILRPSSGRGGQRNGGRNQRGGNRTGGRNNYRNEEKTDFNVGQIISAKISNVDEVNEAQLIGPRELTDGFIFNVKPARIPRIIGKKKSMIELIRKYTESRIAVGQNGLIWVREGRLDLAVKAIKKVEAEAYTSGLTDRMTQYLKSESSK